MAKVMTERRRDPKEVAQMRNMKPPKQPTPPKLLREIAAGNYHFPVGLIFWHLRNEHPDFALTIPEASVTHFKASLEYQEQKPKFVVDAKKNTAGHAFLVVRMADEKTGDQIRVSESTESDLDAAELAKKVRKAKEQIPQLVANARAENAVGMNSEETINALCAAAILMAQQ